MRYTNLLSTLSHKRASFHISKTQKRMNNKLKIGDFAKLCHVSVKTLHHYEKKGLLIPHEIDPWTGHRFYHLSQTVRLCNILHMKSLGMSLDEIAHSLKQGNDTPELKLIEKKYKNCKLEIEKLEYQLHQLEALRSIQINDSDTSQFTIKPIPATIIASCRKSLQSFDELNHLCCNIICPEMLRLQCTCPEPQYSYFIWHNISASPKILDIEYCEAIGEMHTNTPILKFHNAPAMNHALCYQHIGPYPSIPITMTKILAYLETQHLTPIDLPRFHLIHGPWNKPTPAKYLTEIQIPLEY
jgi:DNA-binding transcriptional MerR regulator